VLVAGWLPRAATGGEGVVRIKAKKPFEDFFSLHFLSAVNKN
jgi:hypothetical protein